MSQYFDNDPSLNHQIKTLELSLSGTNLVLLSDKGVFSNREIDEGSVVLLKTVLKSEVSGHILDVGCGYGTLGLYLAKRYSDTKVTLFDVNERAVTLTTENILKNNITNAHVYVANNYQALPKHSFDLIVINPPIRAGKDVYYPLLSAAKDYLTDGGKLMFVIRKSHGAKSAAKFVGEHYSRVEQLTKDAGFYVYVAFK